MRQEVYTESVQRQRRRAERQRNQQIQQTKPSGSPDRVGTALSSNWSGWMSGIAEDDRQPYEERRRKIGKPKDEAVDIDTESTLWELAKQQGDEKFFEWLEKHVWTVSADM
jgi:hypothetical protein